MKKKYRKYKEYFYILFITAAFFCTPLINRYSYIGGSIFLLLIAFIAFILISKEEDNYASLTALFSMIWIGTIGLSNFKIMDYQRVWSIKTWLIYGMAYFIICLMMCITKNRRWKIVEEKINYLDIRNNSVKSLFICNISLFLLSLIGFFMTVRICGFIPFFKTDSLDAYSDFYTKFLLLNHFAMVNIPLCYIVIKKVDKVGLKVLLWFFIFIQAFLIPTLSVNRGIFVVGALMLTIVIFYSENKNIFVLILCLILSFAGYEIGSIGRNYTNEMLKESFQQAEKTEVSIMHDSQISITKEKVSDNANEVDKKVENSESIIEGKENVIKKNKYGDYFENIENVVIVKHDGVSISNLPNVIPAKFLFLYSYLTVSHDNLDLAIKYNDELQYGRQQLNAINFITKRLCRDDNLVYKHYQVQFNLNTDNLLGTAFYDFGIVGVIVFCVLFGSILGIVESLYKFSKSKISLLLLSLAFYCVILSFYSNYTAQFILVMNIFSIIFLSILFKIVDKYIKV